MATVIMNPPYSIKYDPKKVETDIRFAALPLAPKSRADYMFVFDGLSRLEEGEKMAVLLPHGVLFRGGAELDIRKMLLEKGWLEGLIGLPPKLFSGTDIPTVILVFNKQKTDKDIFIINAELDFEKDRQKNRLTDEHITKIKTVWDQKQEVKKYSRLVPYEKIVDNDFNLNLPRYVNTTPDPEPIDIRKVAEEIRQIEIEMLENRKALYDMSLELVNTGEDDGGLDYFRELFKPIEPWEVSASEQHPEKIEKYDKKTGLPTHEMQQMTLEFMDGLEKEEELTEKTIDQLEQGKEWALDNMFVGDNDEN